MKKGYEESPIGRHGIQTKQKQRLSWGKMRARIRSGARKTDFYMAVTSHSDTIAYPLKMSAKKKLVWLPEIMATSTVGLQYNTAHYEIPILKGLMTRNYGNFNRGSSVHGLTTRFQY